MSRLNEIKKIRYKLRNPDLLVLSKEKIEFLCDWAEKGLAAIPKTETAGCEWCDNADEMEVNVKTVSDSGKWVGIKRFSSSKSTFCPNCGRRLEET